jgi:hypothetical protein
MTGASLKSSFLFSWIPPHYSREELFLLALYQTLPHFDAPNFSNGIHFKGKKIAKKEGRETPKKEKKRKPGLRCWGWRRLVDTMFLSHVTSI